MNSDFEKFIRQNREDFDETAPSGNVWKEIEKTLPLKKETRRFTLRDIYAWSAAAAVFFIIMTSAWFLFIKKDNPEKQTVKSAPRENASGTESFNGFSPEYALEFKQASVAVENGQKELRAAVANNPGLYKKFQEDLSILDSSYRLLREQAAQSVNRDVIIRAMIQNLQLQSELLGRQLLIIREFKTTKANQNETDL